LKIPDFKSGIFLTKIKGFDMKQRFTLINLIKYLVWLGLLGCMSSHASTYALSQDGDKSIAWVEKKPVSHLWINPGFYSYHFERDLDLNDKNPGFGLEYQYTTTHSVTVGMYRNSYRDTSHYVGLYWQPIRIGSLKAGVVVGAFRGYSNYKNGGWFPALVPVVTYEFERVALNVSLIPSYQDKLHGALSFQLKFKIGN